MRINLEGVPALYVPFILNQIQKVLLDDDLCVDCYDEILVFNRSSLIFGLQELGNHKMLKRVNSTRYEYYLLFLNHLSRKLKMISLPYTAEYIGAIIAA